MLIYIGEHASLHHTLKKKINKNNNTHSHTVVQIYTVTLTDQTQTLVWQRWNIIYLKYADWTKWESSCQVCTLIEVQLKLNLKPEYWQRVKYKTLSFPFFIIFFLHKLFQKFSLPVQILHHPDSPLSKPPSKCNISQRELQYNTGTGEKTP